MIDTLNVIAALLTIAFGSFGFLAPRFTLRSLDLQPTNSTMGLSEMRASVGGLFVAFGVALLIWPIQMLFVGLGIAYAGAALGRVLSAIIDRPPIKKLIIFGGIEAGLSLWLLLANI